MANTFSFGRSILRDIRYRYRYRRRSNSRVRKRRWRRLKSNRLKITAILLILIGGWVIHGIFSSVSTPLVDTSTVDLWDRVRAGITLAQPDRTETKSEIRWFLAHKNLDEIGDRAAPYMQLVVAEIENRELPMDLALIPIIESNYRPKAHSRVGAVGLWQITKATGKRFGIQRNWWYDGRYDVLASTSAALDYLQYLHRKFDGDWELALAAYNCGDNCVAHAVRRNRKSGKPTDFWSLKLPRETRHYVPRIYAAASVIATPKKYKLRIKAIPDKPYLTKVDTHGQINLNLAARLADVRFRELKRYNSGFRRQVTTPDGPHTLLIPIDRARRFARRLASIPVSNRFIWQHYKIKKGDSLASIASRHNTTVSELQLMNNLGDRKIRVGHHLLIHSPRQ